MRHRIFRSSSVAGLVTLALASLPPTALAASGDPLWQKDVTPPTGFAAIVANPDGSSVMAAGAEQNATSDLLTVARDPANGNVLWDETYDSPTAWDDSASDAAVSPGGTRVFVVGNSRSSFPYDHQGLVVAYDAALGGSPLWDDDFGAAGTTLDSAYGVAVSPNSARVFVTGTVGTLESTKFITIAYRAGTGERIWTKQFRGPEPGGNTAYDIAVAPDGSKVFVTGESFDGTALGFATVAYAASDGTKLWSKRLGRPGAGQAIVALGTKVAVTGTVSATPGGSNYDVATVVYASGSGHLLWTKRYDGPTDGYDQGNALAVNGSGRRVFVTGESEGAFVTLAYRMSDGRREWLKRFAGGAAAHSVELDPGGSLLFVTGFSATVAFDRGTGAKLWDQATGGNDLDVAPDGSAVFVGGGTVFSCGVTSYEA